MSIQSLEVTDVSPNVAISTGFLYITVKNSIGNVPISGITPVLFLPQEYEGTVTDNNGYSIFGLLLAGTYSLQVGGNGFKTELLTVTVVGNKSNSYTITLTSIEEGYFYCILKGRVIDKSIGGGVSGAAVSIVGAEGSCITNVNGLYLLMLPVGTYTMSISKTGYITKTNIVVGVSNESITNNVELVQNASSIEGTVYLKINTTSMVIGGATVIVVKNKVVLGNIKTSSVGKYSFKKLVSGRYEVFVKYKDIQTKKIYRGMSVVSLGVAENKTGNNITIVERETRSVEENSIDSAFKF